MADQGVVYLVVLLRCAKVPPALVLRRPQPKKRSEASLEGRLAARGPPRPCLHIQVGSAEQHVRMPSLVFDARRGVVVPAVAQGDFEFVPACGDEHATIVHCEGRVHEQTHARALRVHQRQPGVEHAVVVADEDSDIRVGVGIGQQSDAHEHGSQNERNGQAGPCVVLPPLLHGPLHQCRDNHRGADAKYQEGKEVYLASFRPHTVAKELEDVDRIRVVFQEVEVREELGKTTDGHARKSGKAEEHRSLKGQQHGKPCRELEAQRSQLRQGKDQEETEVSEWSEELHRQAERPGVSRSLSLLIQQQAELRQEHAQDEDVQIASRIELQEDDREVKQGGGLTPRVRGEPQNGLIGDHRHHDDKPRQRKECNHGREGGTKGEVLQATRQGLEEEPIEHHRRQEPAVRLQRLLRPARPPGLHEKALGDEGLNAGNMA
mmetsp:Transcript_72887/g.236832  ORF Transcript_72887/g.236832 Transcript_72887/m.236832 type:complete len:434 (-) Transcript_72887:3672-4973(-)